MLPAGAAASKKSFELHFSAATVNSIKCCWMGSMGLPLGFLLNKRHHAVAKAIWLTCGMYMCVPKTAGDSFAMVKASARSERQMLEKGIDTHTHTPTSQHFLACTDQMTPDSSEVEKNANITPPTQVQYTKISQIYGLCYYEVHTTLSFQAFLQANLSLL